MAEYVMTPARRAALRKAQLVSARNRNKHGVGRAIAHDARQRAALAYREGQLKHYKAQPHREVAGQKVKALPKKAGKAGTKYVAKKALKGVGKAGLTIGAASAIGYTAYGMTSHGRIAHQNRAANRHLGSMNYGKNTRVASHRVYGSKIKALPRGR
jgi:hypothetical protein